MKYADFNFRQYPVVLVTMNPISPTVAEQDEFFADFEKMFSMNSQAILILNSKNQKLISSEARIAAGQWVKKRNEDVKRKVRVIIFVESSIWLKMVLNAIFMVAKLPVPMHVLKDHQAAREFVKQNYDVLSDWPF